MTHIALLASFRPNIRGEELVVGAVRLGAGVVIAMLSYQLVRRVPWPRPFRWRFAALHVVAAPVAALAGVGLSTPLERFIAPGGTDLAGSERVREFLFIGSFMYMLLVGVSYAAEGSARAARAEAAAARTQLAALRAQLHPHFLFNALHTVVQLIPIDPQRAAEAAEQVGELLRTTLENQRDEWPVRDEWAFVSRYLAIEQIRFADRLTVRSDLPVEVLEECVPAFALQTFVENAVQHGAAPRAAPTEIVIAGSRDASSVTLTVRNSGDGESARQAVGRAGTGLARLRERLAVLYGDAATLSHGPGPQGGYEAVLTVPRQRDS